MVGDTTLTSSLRESLSNQLIEVGCPTDCLVSLNIFWGRLWASEGACRSPLYRRPRLSFSAPFFSSAHAHITVRILLVGIIAIHKEIAFQFQFQFSLSSMDIKVESM